MKANSSFASLINFAEMEVWAICFFLVFLVVYWACWKKFCSTTELPSPPGYPLFGNVLTLLDVPQFITTIEKWADLYFTKKKKMFEYWFFGQRMVVLGDLEAIRFVLLNRPNKFSRFRKLALIFEELDLIHGLFSSEGERWSRHRNLTSSCFNSVTLSAATKPILLVTQRLTKKLYEMKGKEFQAHSLFRLFSSDCTALTVFGCDLNSMEKGSNVPNIIDQIFQVIGDRMGFPIPYWHYFKLGRDKRIDQQCKQLELLAEQYIAQAEKAEHPSNLIGVLLKERNKGEEKLSSKELIQTILTFQAGGQDTTANAIEWATYFLALHPQWVERIREESDGLLDQEGFFQDWIQAGDLPCTFAVWNETLRLRGPAPYVLLTANEDVEIQGIHFPKDTGFMALTRKAFLDSQYFTDPLDFKPERWLKDRTHSDPSSTHNLQAFLPFGGGRRICPGRNLSTLEGIIALATMCHHFHIDVVNKEEVREIFSFTTRPDRLVLTLRPRSERFKMEKVKESVY